MAGFGGDVMDWVWLGAPLWMAVAVLGLVALSAVTRAFFFLTREPIRLPTWAMQGLKYAPLAALTAIIAPEIALPLSGSETGWLDPKWVAAPVAAAWAWWRKDMLSTIVIGMAVYLALKLGVGW